MSERTPASRFADGLLVGAIVQAPTTALLYLGSQLLGFPFFAYDLFDFLTRILPGPVVTVGIDAMIAVLTLLRLSVADSAKTAEQLIAVLIDLIAGTLFGVLFFALAKRLPARRMEQAGWQFGALMGLPSAAISAAFGQSSGYGIANTALYVFVTFVMWGEVLGWCYRKLHSPVAADMSVEQVSRRQFLIRAGAASAAITVIGAGAGLSLAAGKRRRASEQGSTTPSQRLPNADDPLIAAPGTRAELTPVEDHYKVSLRVNPTEITPMSWSLPITGLVENPLNLTLDDLRNNYEPMERYITLSCISNPVGGDLIGTTLWTGVSLKRLLEDVKLKPEARCLYFECADGFYETVSVNTINADERIMLTYDWDGKPLPADHGAPLRIYIPDRYGMKQPKWITSIEVTDEEIEGYWVRRRWDPIAKMHATSVIDTVAVEDAFDQDGALLVSIGGIAHAGVRGVSKIEVRVDDGEWTQAQIRAPLSDTTWVIWRYAWPFEQGPHTFYVRCYEGDGTIQTDRVSDTRPSGATGIHQLEKTL
jgi:DMSO/TMAO reductase YedYZ molybdopterin-dependent catalytic subunit